MATAEKAPTLDPEVTGPGAGAADEAEEQRAAARLGIQYVDMADFKINQDLFRAIPVDLMFRYNFIPWKEEAGRLVVVMSDPSDVLMVDELETLIGRPLQVAVGTRQAIADVLKKSESGQRVLEAATEEFRIQVVRDEEDEKGDEP